MISLAERYLQLQRLRVFGVLTDMEFRRAAGPVRKEVVIHVYESELYDRVSTRRTDITRALFVCLLQVVVFVELDQSSALIE